MFAPIFLYLKNRASVNKLNCLPVFSKGRSGAFDFSGCLFPELLIGVTKSSKIYLSIHLGIRKNSNSFALIDCSKDGKDSSKAVIFYILG